MKVISVFNQKGGTGKSTSSIQLGAWLYGKGYRTAFIDADEQGNLTSFFNLDKEYLGTYDLVSRKHSFNELKVATMYGSLITGSDKLSLLKASLESFKKALEPVKKQYDTIVIDLHPGLSTLTMASLYASDIVLVPINADLFSETCLYGIGSTITSLSTKARVFTFFCNVNPRTSMFKAMRGRISEACKDNGIILLETVIRPCISVPESVFMSKSIFDHAPRSNGAKDYEALFDELTGILEHKSTETHKH